MQTGKLGKAMPSRRLSIGVLFHIVVSAGVFAQPIDLKTDPESPLWWSISPEYSPPQLRSAYLPPDASEARYGDALRSGLVDPLDPNERIVFFYDPGTHPELVPMWHALSIFAHSYVLEDGRDQTLETLREHGMSELGANFVLDMATQQATLQETISQRVRPETMEFVDLQRRILSDSDSDGERQMHERLREALDGEDFEALARLGGITPQRAKHLYDAWNTSPAAEAALQLLPVLREGLSAGDFRAMQEYFLHVIAPSMGPYLEKEEGL